MTPVDEEQRAKLLAEWLNGPAGTPPPEGLDHETLSAVYALSPGRAPSPRVSAEDILSQVSEGPFATPAQTTGSVVGFPTPANQRPANQPPATSRRRPSRLWWAFPGIGAAMAAAAAVAILIPIVGGGSVQDQMYEASRPSAPPSAAAPEGGGPAGASSSDGQSAEVPSPPPAPPPPAFGVPEMAKGDAAPGSVAELGRAEAAAEPVDARDEEERRKDASVAQRGVSPSPSTPTVDAPPLAGAALEADGGGSVAANRLTDDDAGFAYEEEAAKTAGGASSMVAKAERTADKKKATTRSAPNKAAADLSDAPAAPAAPPRAPAPAAQTVSEAQPSGEAVTTTATSSTAMAARAAATPLDYDPGWFRKYPDIVSVYQDAAAKEAARDWAGAVALYRPLVTDARTDLAQDAAWRGARALWAQGKSSEALAMVTAGLKRSGEATVFRVHLLLLQGDLFNAMAKPVDAVRAWDSAADQNRER